MSLGGGEKEDPKVAQEEAQLKAEKEAKNRQLMLQRISALRRMRSGGVSDTAGNQQTLG